MAPGRIVVALAIVAVAWSPVVAVAVVVVALVGRGLCELIGVGGERFFTGSVGSRRHRLS